MSSPELFHSLRSELLVALARTEFLPLRAADQASLEHARHINAAALNIHQLLLQAQNHG
jgi:hypothetical protein